MFVRKTKVVTESEIRSWYDRKYASEGVDAMRPYRAYSVFLDHLEVEKGRKLLDVGCGTGFLLGAAAKKGLQTFGIDISEEAVGIARRVSPDSYVSVGKGENLEFDVDTFDYVTCLGALEHFLDMNKGLQEMKRVAKENATFCIMVPNSNYIFWKLSGKYGTQQQEINENLFPLEQWRDLFVDNGFEIVRVYQDKWNTSVFVAKSLVGILKRMIYKLIWVFLPLNYAYQFIFILRKPRQTSPSA